MSTWPITMDDVIEARRRIAPFVPPTPLRSYAALDEVVGGSVRLFVKHENHAPTNAFKVRNGISALSSLPEGRRARGAVAATRGNFGMGLAWAGRHLGVPVTVCVPHGNNEEKNDGMRALGAELVETGDDYDDALAHAKRLSTERGIPLMHSTNDRAVIAGAATITQEILEQDPELDALVVSVGGGSQAVGAMTVARAVRPSLDVYGVQAAAAPTIHDSWHAGRPSPRPVAPTVADGLATRDVYEMTFGALREGLAGFVTVTEAELFASIRTILRVTHNLVEGAGAAALAGVVKLRDELAGRRVGVILSGGNIDRPTLLRVLSGAA